MKILRTFTVVFSSLNGAEVHLMKNLLHTVEIESIIRGEHRSILLGEVPVDDARVELLVQENDYERALCCIEEHLRADRPDWCCARCAESNPGTFDLCWRCGVSRIHLQAAET